jgi:hypothetical protein
MMAIMKATVSAPRKLPVNTRPQLRRMPLRCARALVQPGQRRQHEHAGQQVKAQQVEHAKAHREQHGAHQCRARHDGGRDGKHRRQRQDGARHVGADQGVRVDM